VSAPERAAVLADFDGSLAPIVDTPSAARPIPAAVDALERLAARLALVGVVTGRTVDFVRQLITDPRIAVVGQYGLERDEGGVVVRNREGVAYETEVATAAEEAQQRWPGLTIERKGSVAVTLHWRTAPEVAPTDAALNALATKHGLAAVPARMACELRPPLDVDKGTAVADLLADHAVEAVAFAGDDQGDVAAFDALFEWAANDPARHVVRIAVVSHESPRDLLESADLEVNGPESFAVLLETLARELA
jgi:trehalose 6-phosphate phosphatase